MFRTADPRTQIGPFFKCLLWAIEWFLCNVWGTERGKPAWFGRKRPVQGVVSVTEHHIFCPHCRQVLTLAQGAMNQLPGAMFLTHA